MSFPPYHHTFDYVDANSVEITTAAAEMNPFALTLESLRQGSYDSSWVEQDERLRPYLSRQTSRPAPAPAPAPIPTFAAQSSGARRFIPGQPQFMGQGDEWMRGDYTQPIGPPQQMPQSHTLPHMQNMYYPQGQQMRASRSRAQAQAPQRPLTVPETHDDAIMEGTLTGNSTNLQLSWDRAGQWKQAWERASFCQNYKSAVKLDPKNTRTDSSEPHTPTPNSYNTRLLHNPDNIFDTNESSSSPENSDDEDYTPTKGGKVSTGSSMSRRKLRAKPTDRLYYGAE